MTVDQNKKKYPVFHTKSYLFYRYISIMKAFLSKYGGRILFWIIFLALIFYFAPRQSDYYLDTDIKQFKKEYFQPFLIGAGVIIVVVLLIYLMYRVRSTRQVLQSFLIGTIVLSFYLFIFQNILLAFALFLNRQVETGKSAKAYIIDFPEGKTPSDYGVIYYELPSKKVVNEPKLYRLLYSPV